MDGQPVWLASISRKRENGRFLYVPEWSQSQMREAEKILRQAVDGVGDVTRERLFRMNVTLCLHRAATDAEVDGQPDSFHSGQGCGLAGGPVEVLSETVPGAPSTKPCLNMSRHVVDKRSPHGWIPKGCGACEPCMAREAAFQRWS